VAVNFEEFFNIPIGQMVRTVLPEGHYFATVKGHEGVESGKGKPMLKWQFSIVSAGEDVPQDQLPANSIGKTVTRQDLLSEDFGLDAIRQTIQACGIATDPAAGFGQYLPQTTGQPVKLYIKQRDRDKDDPSAGKIEDVSKVLPAI
jgi:hypothetical protein